MHAVKEDDLSPLLPAHCAKPLLILVLVLLLKDICLGCLQPYASIITQYLPPI